MILLSAHLDRVRANFPLSFKDGKLVGLLDNILGVETIHHILLDEPNIAALERDGLIRVWHNQSEEWGFLDSSCPELTKNDTVIVVDVCSNKKYDTQDFAIENVSGFSKKQISRLDKFLKWEGFAAKVEPFTGEPGGEDEAWYFKERGIPVLSFVLPIVSPGDGWHRIQDDSSIELLKWKRACEGLKRVIHYFT